MSIIQKCGLAAILSVAALSSVSSAAIHALNDGNSHALIDDASQAGMFNWSVNGQNQLNQQWFWYRVGNAGPEAAINTISAPVTVQPAANTMTTTYTSPGLFTLEVGYLLAGGLPGSSVSDISENITINNLTNAPLDFHFFQYSDFDLAGNPGGEVVELGTALSGKYNEALQVNGPIILQESFTDTVVTPGANRGETAFFNFTLNRLNDGVATNLNNNVGPTGPGDVTWAFQWDLTIPANGSVIISKDKYLQVPEPSSLSLLALGAAGVLRRRRSR